MVGRLLEGVGAEVVAELDMAVDALRVAEMTQPDVVVLDIALVGMTGIEVIPGLKRAVPDCTVVVFSAFDAARRDALAAGADAVVDKSDAVALEDALREVAAGR